MSREEAVDISYCEAIGLLKAAFRRKKQEYEQLSIMNANAIGKMLFGGKDGGSPTPSSSGRENGGGRPGQKKKSAYWSGGRSTTKPDLSPNPKRERLRELAEMEPQPLDPLALGKLAEITGQQARRRME